MEEEKKQIAKQEKKHTTSVSLGEKSVSLKNKYENNMLINCNQSDNMF